MTLANRALVPELVGTTWPLSRALDDDDIVPSTKGLRTSSLALLCFFCIPSCL